MGVRKWICGCNEKNYTQEWGV